MNVDTDPDRDSKQPGKKNVRLAVILGGIAVAVYIGFIMQYL